LHFAVGLPEFAVLAFALEDEFADPLADLCCADVDLLVSELDPVAADPFDDLCLVDFAVSELAALVSAAAPALFTPP
jgi:hypothetical protein